MFDSVSVATTFKERLGKAGVIFCSFSEAVQKHPALVEKYLGTVVPYTDNYFATLNSAVFTDGSFVFVPKGVRCPMELSTYFRINAAKTGQFERTLIIAEEGAHVSYLEGCTAPMRDENQLHAAVVELVALENAQIKYSTVQNWYPGDENGRGGIYNFVTKRGECRGANSRISWTQVETGSAITWKYPSCILTGDNSVGEFYSVAVANNYQQADTGTKMIHIGRNTRSTIVSKGISAGHGQNSYRGLVKVLPSAVDARNYTQCDSLLMGDKCGAHTFPYMEVRTPTASVEHEATTSKIGDDQLFYCLSRGISEEDAVNMIVNGFCKVVFKELPMEFAVEAQNLLAVSLEGCSRMSMLKIDNLHVTRRRQAGAERHEPGSRRGRSARHHGAERLRQEHAGAGAGGPRRLRGHRRHRELSGPRPAGAGARRARPRRRVPRVPVPGRDPGREQRLPAEGRSERAAQASRPAGARRLRVPGAGAREDEADAHGRELPQPRRQRRLLRRREEAQRDPADGGARAGARAARRNRFRPRHRRAARGRERREQPAARRTARS